MAVSDLTEWLGEFCAPGIALCVKRLSGNDTLANGTHQAGPYIPKEFLFRIFPTINRTDVKNPDRWFELAVDSHLDVRQVRAVYYNSKRFEGKPNGRDETRLTNFGGGVEWAPGAGHDQSADLTMGRVCCSSNCTGLM